MKCPHCSNDIKESVITKEADRIQRRKSKRKLTSGAVPQYDGKTLEQEGGKR